MLKFSALCLAAFLPYALGGGCGGQLIGTLPTLAHDVSGELFVVDDRTFCIENFNYDGQGPDAFLYLYYIGDPIDNTGGGVYVPLTQEQQQFELGRVFTDETLVFTLPQGLQTCDFEGFGIWCRYANELFTSITWDNDQIFQNIMCRPSPGRGFVGTLETLEHSVSGQLYVRDNKTLVIRDFTYDGMAPDTFIYWYSPGAVVDQNGGGFIIPLPAPAGDPENDGRFTDIVYTLPQPDFIINIPDEDVYTCDIGTFTIWCREASVFFTTLAVDGELFSNNPLEVAYSPDLILCDRPSTRPGLLIGELPTTDSRAISGTFYIQDRDTFFIQLFSYDASRENTFLYYYPDGVMPDTTGEGGMRIGFSAMSEALPTDRAGSFFNSDLIVDLRRAAGEPVTVCSVGYFSILDEDAGEILTMIQIPEAERDAFLMCAGATTLRISGAIIVALLSLSFFLKP